MPKGNFSKLPPAVELAAMIRNGERSTDIAKRHGVSTAAVSRRLNDGGFSGRNGQPLNVPTQQDESQLAVVEHDEEWRDRALCAQTDPEEFFPEKGGSTKAAKLICGRCEVTAECLQYALDTDQRFGIWGNKSERERRLLRAVAEGRIAALPQCRAKDCTATLADLRAKWCVKHRPSNVSGAVS